MMKINVKVIRWGLTVVNIGGIAMLVMVFLGMFGMTSSEKKVIRLVEPNDFALPMDVPRLVPNKYQSVIRDFYRKKPEPIVAPIQAQREPEMPILDGGPLRDWNVMAVIISEEGRRFATIQDKSAATPVANSASTGRVASSRTRGSTSRNSSRGRVSSTRRGVGSRLPIAQATARTRYLEKGKEFRVEEEYYEVLDISQGPRTVIYKHNGRTYTLKTESIIDPVINETENGLVLRGFTPEEVEAYGLNAGLPGGRQKPATNVGIPADTRGVIKNGKGEVVPTDRKGVSSNPAGDPAASNRNVNRSGVSATAKSSSGRAIKNTNKGSIRGGIDKETPDQKASRKQLEATLGIDLQKNPEGAIRQLEGLQRNQGGRPSRDQ